MKILRLVFLFLGVIFSVWGYAQNNVKAGKWYFSVDKTKNCISVSKDGRLLTNGLYAAYKLNDQIISTKEYTSLKMKSFPYKDKFGQGTKIVVNYIKRGLPELQQFFYLYPNKDYLFTEFEIRDKCHNLKSNYMAPVNIENSRMPFYNDENRALFIPFDNDCWIRYQSKPLAFDTLRSYEVTAIYNIKSRNSLVIGSVEHQNWKSAVDLFKGDGKNIQRIVCFGGVADKLTRDSKEHGYLNGAMIKSPKILLGLFSDWREGLDEFGKANALIAPRRPWNKAVPFGWNSWGVLQFKLNYNKAMEVSDYIHENLQNNNFCNKDKIVYVGLDAGWSKLTEAELKKFVMKCKANGQVAGIYWTPFTDWGKKPERVVDDSPEYKYKDIYLYANGKPQELDGAYAIDPTHPAVETMMKKISGLFRRCGFEYVKMDFMTHGMMESDHWNNKSVCTGTQAYNYGMKLIDKYFKGMYINLSISPIFPANYAQSRRIACDAWNKIKDTEYTMNALSYGWWIDNIYSFNDADHVVLHDATEGENRARVTSAIITGLFISGEDFSNEAKVEGKNKSFVFLTNTNVNVVANGVSFMPVEGDGILSENQFMKKDLDAVYYVIFNYMNDDFTKNVPLKRLGLDDTKHYKATDLWNGKSVDLESELHVPANDVRFIKIVSEK